MPKSAYRTRIAEARSLFLLLVLILLNGDAIAFTNGYIQIEISICAAWDNYFMMRRYDTNYSDMARIFDCCTKRYSMIARDADGVMG